MNVTERIQKSGPLERALVGLLREAYRQGLVANPKAAPLWMGKQILSASENADVRVSPP